MPSSGNVDGLKSRLINLINMQENDWLSARDAQERLGVRAQTLYAYVSRGQVQAEPDPSDPRRSRYSASDIAGLAKRKARGRKAAAVAADAIAWGEPVLTSSITTVQDGRLYYRGLDAVLLAQTETFEGVARRLRGGGGAPAPRALRKPPPSGPSMRARLFTVLASRAASDPPALDQAPDALDDAAATLLDVVTDAICEEVGAGPIHRRVARAWALGPTAEDLIRRSLVLLADHELNASTFAARVAASTGASLAAATLAGAATLTGPLHGGVAAQLDVLAEEAERQGPGEAVAARLAHWRPTPGFGHPLYPQGDPRARALLDLFQAPPALRALSDAVEEATGARNNVDFALVALARTLDLPADAPFVLFALARCAGWLAHAKEQVETGALIRPRARYVGPEPAQVSARGRRPPPASPPHTARPSDSDRGRSG
jgi:citrate synthase